MLDLGYFVAKANSKNNEDKIKRYIVESHASEFFFLFDKRLVQGQPNFCS